MIQKIVRYEHWEKDSGIFQFALSDCLDYLLAQPQSEENQTLIKDMQSHAMNEDVIFISGRKPSCITYVCCCRLVGERLRSGSLHKMQQIVSSFRHYFGKVAAWA